MRPNHNVPWFTSKAVSLGDHQRPATFDDFEKINPTVSNMINEFGSPFCILQKIQKQLLMRLQFEASIPVSAPQNQSNAPSSQQGGRGGGVSGDGQRVILLALITPP